MSTVPTTQPSKKRARTTTRRVLGVVETLLLVWLLLGLVYVLRVAQMEPSLIRLWVVVQTVLGVTKIVLDVRSRR